MYISKLPGLHSSQTLDGDWRHALLFAIFIKYQSTIDPVISLIYIGFLSSLFQVTVFLALLMSAIQPE